MSQSAVSLMSYVCTCSIDLGDSDRFSQLTIRAKIPGTTYLAWLGRQVSHSPILGGFTGIRDDHFQVKTWHSPLLGFDVYLTLIHFE